MQGGLTLMGGLALCFTLFSGWADRRRQRRDNIEAVGFMPWPLLTIMGTLATLLCFALAVKLA